MNISWRFPASAVIFAPPAIRNGWLNSGNGYALKCLNPFPTANGYSAGKDDDVPALIDSDLSGKEFRRNWARLIQKVYENWHFQGTPVIHAQNYP